MIPVTMNVSADPALSLDVNTNDVPIPIDLATSINIGGEEVHAQSKTVIPSTEEQTVLPDEPEYNYLSRVTVEAFPFSGTISISENGTYDVTSYAQAAVSVVSGIIIPEGFALYNGYFLPQIPTGDGYDYTFIRFNPVNNTFDCVQGTSNWRARSSSTLDNWQLEFANQATVRSRQYSIPQDGTATDWGEFTASVNYYGTTNGRKVIWSSHDIMISTTTNILYKHGIALYPQ